jgi:peptidylprolyl isomerase
VIIAAVVIVIVVSTSGSGKKNNNAGGAKPTPAATTSAAASPSTSTSAAAPVSVPTAACAKPPTGGTASYKGVTVGQATNLKKAPKVSAKAAGAPTTLECQDLVVGKGRAATPASTVSVQYTGVLYKNGTLFDSSWSKGGKPVQFSLSGVVPGFTQGIGGAGKVAPMRVGGRRLMILPASLGYGAQANGPIPANSTLVFVVDLTSIG